MKYICNLDDCGHLFNNLRGIKKHYHTLHGLDSDYKQYLTEFSLNTPETIRNNPETNENNDETSPTMPVIPDIIKTDMPESEGLSKEFKEIFELTSIRKKLAKERFIEGMYNKLTRDLNKDEDFYAPEQINTEQLKQELKQELMPAPNTMPTQTSIDPNQTSLAQFGTLIAPYIPKLIQIIAGSTGSASKGAGLPW